MQKDTTTIVLGILIAIIPFLGIPGTWKTVLFIVLGLVIALIAFFARMDRLSTRLISREENEESASTATIKV